MPARNGGGVSPASGWSVQIRRWLPLAAVILYLALALPQLNLPGLHYDEAKEAGLNALEMLRAQNVQAFRSAGVQIGPLFLPIMVQDYIGALNVYLALPFLAALGATVTALRLLAVACGLATLLLAWQLGDELGRLAGNPRPWTGGIAALLLAVSPSFLFWSRQGIFVTNIVVTLAVATVWAVTRWRRSGRAGWLYSAAFLAGLGLWTKLLFVWVLGALVGVAIVVWVAGKIGRRGKEARKGKDGKKGNEGKAETVPSPQPLVPRPQTSDPTPHTLRPIHWLIAALCFLLGVSPLILFNQQTSGTLNAVFGNLGQSYYGVNNADFFANLSARVGQLVTLLRGDHFWYLGGPFANGWAAPLAAGLITVAVVAAVTTLRRRGQTNAGAVLGMALLFVVLLVLQSSFTVSDLFITHDAIVQPFLLLLVALAVEVLLLATRGVEGSAAGGRAWRVVAALAVLALTAWLAGDLRADVRYHRALAETGGHATHSDAVQRLADWLDQENAAQPLALDWGIDAPVRYLTGNRVQPLEVFGYERIGEPDAGFVGRIEPLLDDPGRLVVLHTDQDTVFQGRRAALEALAGQRGRIVEEVATFNERNGSPVFVVLRLR
ncbi:MAG: glycosyltransferase family 39 protein [Anaerolineales bacterium]|nr:glycosyltransferase family 39 protein [Anaerolineales bacterium]